MLGKRAQLFTFLLVVFSVVILGTAMFFISAKPAKLGYTIGNQEYALTKMYYANEKYRAFLEYEGEVILKKTIPEVLFSQQSDNCEKIGEYTYWLKGGKKCIPKLLAVIQTKFNEDMKEKLDFLAKEKAMTFLFNNDQMYISSSLDKQKDYWQLPIEYTLTPLDDTVIATASAPWTWRLHDQAEANRKIGVFQAYPNLKLKNIKGLYAIPALYTLPDEVESACSKVPDSSVRDCVALIAEQLKLDQKIFDYEIVMDQRTAKIKMNLKEFPQNTINMALEIPSEDTIRVTEFSSEYKGGSPSAFLLEGDDPITLKGKVVAASKTGLEIRWCIKGRSEKPAEFTWENCPNKFMIFSEGKFSANAQGTTTANEIGFQATVSNPRSMILKNSDIAIGIKRGDQVVFSSSRIFVSV